MCVCKKYTRLILKFPSSYRKGKPLLSKKHVTKFPNFLN